MNCKLRVGNCKLRPSPQTNNKRKKLNPMHIAYSALNDSRQQQNQAPQTENELQLRYLAYQTVCSKYSREIAAIQKHLPGWMPKFR